MTETPAVAPAAEPVTPAIEQKAAIPSTEAAALAQGVGDVSQNAGRTSDTGNAPPAAPSNEPPAVEKTEADKLAEAKAVVDADADATAKAEADAQAARENDPLDQEVWGSTGDDVADSVLTTLQNAGVTPDEAKVMLWDAVKALKDKVGDAKATLVMAGVTSFVEKQSARNAAIIKDIESVSGGEENWKTMAAWGKENLAAAALTEYRTMIDKGGAQARFAAGEIARAYNADSANTTLAVSTAAPTVEGDAGAGPSARSTSRAEYVAELDAAHRGNPTEAALQEITAARHRGRTKGI
jgi:hypothetical protein